MPGSTDHSPAADDLNRAQLKLSDMVTTIELTMISVIAGLMLFPLIDYTTPLVRELRFEYWVYPFICVATVMFFWTALIAHALTFIGWPIDITHNLLYLLVFPVTGIQMHFMSEPLPFYIMLGIMALLSVALVAYDLSLVATKRKGAQGAAAALYAAVYKRQAALLFHTILAALATGLVVALVFLWPQLFIEQHLHVVLGFGILGFIVFMLGSEFRQLNSIRNKILAKTAEEMAEERERRMVEGLAAFRVPAAGGLLDRPTAITAPSYDEQAFD